jgi:hypothetical protein
MGGNKIFEIHSKKANSIVNTLLTEKNIEGFIYSFFDYYNLVNGQNTYNSDYKKEIIKNDNVIRQVRSCNLFDKENKEITLTDKEIDYINSEYFEKKLNTLFENIENELNKFHSENKKTFREELIEFYNNIENKLNNNNYDAYNFGRISNLDKINCGQFRNSVNSRLLSLKENILERKNILENKINHNKENQIWINIFKTEKAFNNFKYYLENKIIDDYADLSYLYQKLSKENIINKMKHLEFNKWLFEKKLIKENVFNEIESQNGFRSFKKSYSKHRESNYSEIFKK